MAATASPSRYVDEFGVQRPLEALAPRPRRRWFRPAWLLGLPLLLILVTAAGGAFWVAWGLPDLDLDRPVAGQHTIILEAADGTPIAQNRGAWAGPVNLAEVPDHMIKAVLAIEDRRFYDHVGLDPLGIVRAAWRNLRSGGVVEGGSTITQQLAKVLFLTPEQTFRRKLQEAAIATWMEMRLSKDEILAKYLESVYFGAGATGLPAAAKVYFNKPVSELTLAESAMLAGLVRAPSRLNPRSSFKAARERATLVLNAMVETGQIPREEALAAALDPARPVHSTAVEQTGSYFSDWIYTDAVHAMGPLVGSARIRTTLDPKLQKLAEASVARILARPEESGGKGPISQAALVAMRLDGSVVAMVGGRNYAESQFNRAVTAERQPGSAFKTFVYLAALRAGWEPDDTIKDAPIEIDGWKPKNYGNRFYGEVTLEQAFARSPNASTVRLAQDVGIENVIATARELGIDADMPSNMTLALGTAETSLLDLTGAYASIAAGRAPLEPWGIAGVSETPDSEPRFFERSGAGTGAVEHRDDMVRLLTAVVEDGTGKRAALDGFAAGKTGTSQNNRDAWFVGVTEELVVGVWVGNDDNTPMNDVTGGTIPAAIWREFTAQATGLEPAGAVPNEEPVPEGPPVADEGGEPATDIAAVNAAPDAELEEEQGSAEPPAEDDLAAEPPPEGVAAEPPPEAEPVPAEAAPAPAPPARVARPRPEPRSAVAAPPEPKPPAAEPRAAPKPRVAVQRAEPKPRVAEQRTKPKPPATKPRAEPKPQVARRTERAREAAPERPTRQGPIARRLAERRQFAEEYAARRRAEAERKAGARSERRREGGPSILLGGRGIPSD